jgi:hypothetical protein
LILRLCNNLKRKILLRFRIARSLVEYFSPTAMARVRAPAETRLSREALLEDGKTLVKTLYSGVPDVMGLHSHERRIVLLGPQVHVKCSKHIFNKPCYM